MSISKRPRKIKLVWDTASDFHTCIVTDENLVTNQANISGMEKDEENEIDLRKAVDAQANHLKHEIQTPEVNFRSDIVMKKSDFVKKPSQRIEDDCVTSYSVISNLYPTDAEDLKFCEESKVSVVNLRWYFTTVANGSDDFSGDLRFSQFPGMSIDEWTKLEAYYSKKLEKSKEDNNKCDHLLPLIGRFRHQATGSYSCFNPRPPKIATRRKFQIEVKALLHAFEVRQNAFDIASLGRLMHVRNLCDYKNAIEWKEALAQLRLKGYSKPEITYSRRKSLQTQAIKISNSESKPQLNGLLKVIPPPPLVEGKPINGVKNCNGIKMNNDGIESEDEINTYTNGNKKFYIKNEVDDVNMEETNEATSSEKQILNDDHFLKEFEDNDGLTLMETLQQLYQQRSTGKMNNKQFRKFDKRMAKFSLDNLVGCDPAEFSKNMEILMAKQLNSECKLISLMTTNGELMKKLSDLQLRLEKGEDIESDEVHKEGISSLAKLTAKTVEYLVRLVRQIILGQEKPELELIFITTHLICRRLLHFASEYINFLSLFEPTSKVEESMTNIFYQSSTANLYLKKALGLVRPFFPEEKPTLLEDPKTPTEPQLIPEVVKLNAFLRRKRPKYDQRWMRSYSPERQITTCDVRAAAKQAYTEYFLSLMVEPKNQRNVMLTVKQMVKSSKDEQKSRWRIETLKPDDYEVKPPKILEVEPENQPLETQQEQINQPPPSTSIKIDPEKIEMKPEQFFELDANEIAYVPFEFNNQEKEKIKKVLISRKKENK
uniref:Uncharacterized protein n=1 Tax=Panagrolaimus sp. JU765 TaxID=591449 RepID=A0AC34QPT2_9BILA